MKNFITGLKNLIRWFPTIWNDRDWDDHYIWELMIKKLKFQSKYIGERDFHTTAKRDSEIMNLCVNLMEKVRTEYYNTEYQNYNTINVKFVPTTLSDGKKVYEYKSDVVSENFDEYFKKYPKVYKKVIENFNMENKKLDKYNIAFHMSLENHKRAKKILFKLLEFNIENWWE